MGHFLRSFQALSSPYPFSQKHQIFRWLAGAQETKNNDLEVQENKESDFRGLVQGMII